MGLFNFGKKKDDASNFQQPKMVDMPALPEFPSLDDPHMDHFDSSAADIKKEVGRGMTSHEDLDIPLRNPGIFGKTMVNTQLDITPHEMDTPLDLMSGFNSPPLKMNMQFSAPPQSFNKRMNLDEDKPLFIRIDNYKKAMSMLDALKEKLTDAEDVLKGLEEVRSQEELKLETWKRDIQGLKEKLLSIDKELFEV